LRLSGLTKNLRANTRPLIESFGEAINTSNRAPTLVLSAVALIGLAMLARRRAWMILFIVLLSVAVIWPMPWRNQFYRYAVPLTPFLMIGAMMIFDQLCAALSSLPMRPSIATFGRVTLGLLLILALTFRISSVWELFRDRAHGDGYVDSRGSLPQRFFHYSDLSREWDAASAWIQSHSNADEIVATHLPQYCYLRTGRRAVMPPVERDRDRMRQLLDSVPVSYVILDPIDWMPAVEKDNEHWRRVESVNRVRLYERISSGE
jgi:hypothetical protein